MIGKKILIGLTGVISVVSLATPALAHHHRHHPRPMHHGPMHHAPMRHGPMMHPDAAPAPHDGLRDAAHAAGDRAKAAGSDAANHQIDNAAGKVMGH